MAITLPQSLPFPLVSSSAEHTTGDLHYFVPPAGDERPFPFLCLYEDDDRPNTNVFLKIHQTQIYDLRSVVDSAAKFARRTSECRRLE